MRFSSREKFQNFLLCFDAEPLHVTSFLWWSTISSMTIIINQSARENSNSYCKIYFSIFLKLLENEAATFSVSVIFAAAFVASVVINFKPYSYCCMPLLFNDTSVVTSTLNCIFICLLLLYIYPQLLRLSTLKMTTKKTRDNKQKHDSISQWNKFLLHFIGRLYSIGRNISMMNEFACR